MNKEKVFKMIAALLMIAGIIIIGKSLLSNTGDSVEPLTQEQISSANRATYEAYKQEILICIAFVEDFHAKSYHDKAARWTIGYGTTVYPNGQRVSKKDKEISKEYAKTCVYAHCDKRVSPWIRYVKRPLTPEQMLGACVFIYNIGGEKFSGHKANGEKFAEPSNFLTYINAGKDDAETAKTMNGFRCVTDKNGKKKLAPGLPKRHWIEGALYQGLITADDLLHSQPAKFYEKKYGFDLSFYYKSQNGPYWEHDYSREKIQEFLKKNRSDTHNVQAIL